MSGSVTFSDGHHLVTIARSRSFLTAAIVGLGMVVVTSVGGGIETMGGNISDNLGTQSIGYTSGQ